MIADAMERALSSLASSVAGASGGWLLLGVLLHVANQVARACGWYALLRGACEGDRPRLRDVLLTWLAGAGAGGVLSARGGDAIRVLLISRRVPETRTSVLAGTLVAEAAGDTFVGVLVLVAAVMLGAAPALGLPGAETAGWVAVALLSLALACQIARRRRAATATGPSRMRSDPRGRGQGLRLARPSGDLRVHGAAVADRARACCAAARSRASSPRSTCRPASLRSCS